MLFNKGIAAVIEMIFSGNNGPITLPDSVTTVTGEKTFAIQATEQSWVVPAGVYDIQAVLIACGGSGVNNKTADGGRGGDLRWINRLAVTPGETLYVLAPITDTVDAYIRRGDTILLRARSGKSATPSTTIRLPFIGGGNGGLGGVANVAASIPGGGGGAGGYSGDGGNGGTGNLIPPTAGSGGAGGGGAGWTYNGLNYGAAGGGVGFKEEGDSGDAGVYSAVNATGASGKGGSGGSDGTGGSGSIYGSGAGSGGAYGGGRGFARIIWGSNRTFPNNAA